jgi:hypothetical protein
MGREGRKASASEGRWIRERADAVNMSPTPYGAMPDLEPDRIVLARQLDVQDPHIAGGRVLAGVEQDAEIDDAAAYKPFSHAGKLGAHSVRRRSDRQVLDRRDQIPKSLQGLRCGSSIGEESVRRGDDVGRRTRRDNQFAAQAASAGFDRRGGDACLGVIQDLLEESLGFDPA